MLNLLSICILGLLIISFIAIRDIFSPPCIICASYLLSIISGLINSAIVGWDFDISYQTFIVCLIGIGIFVLASILIQKHYKIIRGLKKNSHVYELDYILVSRFVTRALLLYQTSVLCLYVYYFYKGVGGFSFSTFIYVMQRFRSATYVSDGTLDIIPSVVNQLVKFAKMNSLLSIYVVIHNSIYNRQQGSKKISNKILLLNVVMYFPLVVLTGGRYYMVMHLFSAFFIWAILRRLTSNKAIDITTFMRIIAIIAAILFFFTATKSMVGRVSEKGTLEYISSYIGCNIKSLDVYMENPVRETSIWGKETFVGFNRILQKMDLVPPYNVYLDFVSFQGVGMGNTYTGFRSEYHDFGMAGVIILQAVEATIMMLIYKKCSVQHKNKLPFCFIVYAELMPYILMHSYSEVFYSAVISLSFIVFILSFCMFRYFMRFSKSGRLTFIIRRKL